MTSPQETRLLTRLPRYDILRKTDRTAEAPIIRTTRRVFGKKAAVAATAGVVATGVAAKTGVLQAVSEEVRRGIEQALDSPMGKPVNYDPITKGYYFVGKNQKHQVVEIELVLADKPSITAFKEPNWIKEHRPLTFQPTPNKIYYAKRFAGATYPGTTGETTIGEDSVGVYFALTNIHGDFVDPPGNMLPEGQRLHILGNHVNPIEDKFSGETADPVIPTPQFPMTSAGVPSGRPAK